MPEQICPHCGESHQLEAQFCPVTGQPLDVASTTDDRTRWQKVIWVIASILLSAGILGSLLWSLRQPSSVVISTHRATIAGVETVSPAFSTEFATLAAIFTVTPTRFVTTTLYASAMVPPTATPRPSFTATATPTDDSWQACQNTYASRLHIGDQAYVSFDPPYSNNVRQDPNMDSEIIGKINPGEEILVLEGPACSNHWVWWLVRSRKTGLVGWTSEGDIENYWLVPLPEE